MSMHIASLVKILCYLLKLSTGNEKMGVSRANNSVKNWRILPISNSKPDLYNINAQTSLVKIHWCLLKLSSGNEKRTEGRTDRHTDIQREAIIPRHYCVAGYKKKYCLCGQWRPGISLRMRRLIRDFFVHLHDYSLVLMTRTSLGPWKIVWDMGSSSYRFRKQMVII